MRRYLFLLGLSSGSWDGDGRMGMATNFNNDGHFGGCHMSPEAAAAIEQARLNNGIYWTEGDPRPLDGIDEALSLGHLKRDVGSGWEAQEGVRITKSGLSLLGLAAPSIWEAVVLYFKGRAT